MRIEQYIGALKQCAREHKEDITPTCNVVVSNLCNDTAKYLEDIIKLLEDRVKLHDKYLKEETNDHAKYVRSYVINELELILSELKEEKMTNNNTYCFKESE